MPHALFFRAGQFVGATECPTTELAELQTNPWSTHRLVLDVLPAGDLATDWRFDEATGSLQPTAAGG